MTQQHHKNSTKHLKTTKKEHKKNTQTAKNTPQTSVLQLSVAQHNTFAPVPDTTLFAATQAMGRQLLAVAITWLLWTVDEVCGVKWGLFVGELIPTN